MEALLTRDTQGLTDRIFSHDHIALKLCKHGLMVYNKHDSFIGRSLDLYGEWAESELETLGSLIRPGHVVLDIGANVGTHTVYFAKAVTDTGTVYAFEPHRLTFQTLCGNLALNGITNVQTEQVAAASAGGIDESGDEPVTRIRIDDLHLERCDVVRIGAAGDECDILEGARNTILRCRPWIYLTNDRESSSQAIIAAIRSYDYECYWQLSYPFNPANHFKNGVNAFDDRRPAAHMLCVHKSIPLSGMVRAQPTDDWRSACDQLT